MRATTVLVIVGISLATSCTVEAERRASVEEQRPETDSSASHEPVRLGRSVTPGCGRILFTRWSPGPGSLHSIRPDGRGEKNLTEADGGDIFAPQWSPDAKHIMFEFSRRAKTELKLIDADGSGLHTIKPPNGYSIGGADWHPDGRRIAYVEFHRGARAPRVIVQTLRTGETEVVGKGSSPSWSPDGSRLAFSGYSPENPLGAGGLIVYDFESSQTAALTNEGPTGDTSPVWSPNGAELVVERYEDDPVEFQEYAVLWKIGDDEERLTEDFDYAGAALARWSPDGDRLAYVEMWDEGGSVHLLDLKTKKSAPVPTGEVSPLLRAPWRTDPDFSPDGAMLVMETDRELQTVATNGKNLSALTHPQRGSHDSEPDWSPC